MPRNKTTRIGKGAGKGDGWGGPANGTRRFEKGHPKYPPNSADPQWPELLKSNLFDLAMNAEREETRVTATVAALNRLEGTPVATSRLTGADDGPIKIEDTRKPLELVLAEALAKVKKDDGTGSD